MTAAVGIAVERDIRVAMRDGVRLACDVYRPAGDGRFPVILERTPYDKTAPSRSELDLGRDEAMDRLEVARSFVAHGYVVI